MSGVAGGPAASSGAAEETQRAVPYHCPFCAEEDLRPVEAAVEG